MLSSPMHAIPPKEEEDFWLARWSQNRNFDNEQVNQLFLIHKVFNEDMNEIVIMHFLDLESMIKLITKRGNLSAPDPGPITFPFVKLEKESAARMIIEMLLFIILHMKIPDIWKMGKTTLIFKAGNVDDPGNWRPIILAFVIYGIILGIIA
jgi:hypothetical protein